jgi:hypothetical protein
MTKFRVIVVMLTTALLAIGIVMPAQGEESSLLCTLSVSESSVINVQCFSAGREALADQIASQTIRCAHNGEYLNCGFYIDATQGVALARDIPAGEMYVRMRTILLSEQTDGVTLVDLKDHLVAAVVTGIRN